MHEVLLVVRATIPLKLLRAVTVRVEVPAVPEVTVTLVGLEIRVKSWTMNVTVAV